MAMNRALAAAIVLIFGCMPGEFAAARQASTGSTEDLRAEILELKRLVAQLRARIEVLERQVRDRENVHVLPGQAWPEVRPVLIQPVGRFFVDQYGTIREKDGRPVGIWGVNGDSLAAPSHLEPVPPSWEPRAFEPSPPDR